MRPPFCIRFAGDDYERKTGGYEVGKNIAVAGAGYVGLSIGVLLAQANQVTVVCTTESKVDDINSGKSPIIDRDISRFFAEKSLSLTATTNGRDAYEKAELVIVATPTNYDPFIGGFDTTSVDIVIATTLEVNPSATIIIKSTVPVGYTDAIISKYGHNKIFFSPEFLREGKALFDNLYPSRIVVGSAKKPESQSEAESFAKLLVQGSLEQDTPVLITSNAEAESIKLFANTYLALRIGFFNELDMYAEAEGLDSKRIIEGICLDPRIGNHYNNPSFGYGGYCLPKDTKQLLSTFGKIPNHIIRATVDTNSIRKDFIVDRILQKAGYFAENPQCVIGFYRLAMKKGSDNFRESSSQEIMHRIKLKRVKVVIYEPLLPIEISDNFQIIHNLEEFKKISDIIVANRIENEIIDTMDKIYTRDLFYRD